MDNYLENTRLIEEVQKGDEQAIRQLFRLHYSSLCYYAEGIVGDRQEAEDIAVDTFLKFLNRKEHFHHPTAVRAFLFTTVKNAAIDFLRKEERHGKAHRELYNEGGEMEQLTEEKMLAAKVLQAIYEEVERLPPQCRIIFHSLFFEEKTTAQVAAEMGLSTQTVLNQKSKAIRHLQHFLYKKGLLNSVTAMSVWLQFFSK